MRLPMEGSLAQNGIRPQRMARAALRESPASRVTARTSCVGAMLKRGGRVSPPPSKSNLRASSDMSATSEYLPHMTSQVYYETPVSIRHDRRH